MSEEDKSFIDKVKSWWDTLPRVPVIILLIFIGLQILLILENTFLGVLKYLPFPVGVIIQLIPMAGTILTAIFIGLYLYIGDSIRSFLCRALPSFLSGARETVGCVAGPSITEQKSGEDICT